MCCGSSTNSACTLGRCLLDAVIFAAAVLNSASSTLGCKKVYAQQAIICKYQTGAYRMKLKSCSCRHLISHSEATESCRRSYHFYRKDSLFKSSY